MDRPLPVRRCSPELRQRARQLRREPTPAEALLWKALRRNGLGPAFRRQHPAGTHIFDFYCPAHRLVVEVDGAGHHTVEGMARDALTRAHGVRVLRFPNDAVLRHLPEVLARIRAALEDSRPE